MGDNVPITSGAGLSIAADEDGGSQLHQWIKVKFGDDGDFQAVTTLSGFPVQILSLPDLGLNSSVRITSLPDLGANSSLRITSLPDLGANSSIKVTSLPALNITSLPDLGANSSVKITSLPALGVGSSVVITSLPDLGAGSSVRITSLPALTAASVTVSNLGTTLQLVSGTTISIVGLVSVTNHAITSLPDLGANSSVKITSLPDLGANSSIKITSLPNLGAGSTVAITSSAILPVNIVAGGAGDGSILDGSDTSIKATVVSYANSNVIAVRLSDTNGDYIAAGGGTQYADGAAFGTAIGTIAMGLDGTAIQALACNTSGHLRVEIMSQPAVAVSIAAVTISNLASVPLTVSGTTIAITSLPDLGLNSSVKITSLPDLGAGSTLKITSLPAIGFGGSTTITSLPDLGAGSSIKITSLPALTTGAVTVSNLATALVSATVTSVGTFRITSLPDLGANSSIKITSLPALTTGAVTVSNLATALVSATVTSIGTFRITSLPDLGLNSSIKITSLPVLAAASIISINNLTVNRSINNTLGNFPVQIIPNKSIWRFTATQTGAGTLLVKALVNSFTAIYITNIVVSNENTAGNVRFIESTTNVAIRPVIERLYFAANGGAVIDYTHPIRVDTNCALYAVATTVGNYSVSVSGFTGPIETSL